MNSIPTWYVCWIAIFSSLLLSTNSMRRLEAQDDSPPNPHSVSFVAAFERFARHGQMTPPESGVLLLTELGCTHCHRTDNPALLPKAAPLLESAGLHLQPNYLKGFLSNPQGSKPGTTMPHLHRPLFVGAIDHQLESLVAYVSSLRKPFPPLKADGRHPLFHEFWKKGDPTRGAELYHSVGCVACHAPDENFQLDVVKESSLEQLLKHLSPEDIEELGLKHKLRKVESIPHGNLSMKHNFQSLTYFLMDPLKYRPGGRMPSLQLNVSEAADIAAWLLRDSNGSRTEIKTASELKSLNPTQVAQGKKLFETLQCNVCHVRQRTAASNVGTEIKAKSLFELNAAAKQSCMQSPSSKMPLYSLDDQQKRSIRAALEHLKSTPNSSRDEKSEVLSKRELASHKVRETLWKFNCYACHEREEMGGPGHHRQKFFHNLKEIDIGDEGRFPPNLTGVGKKLQPSWLKRVLSGTGDVRPYLSVRMPVFPAEVQDSLPQTFAIADEFRSKSESHIFSRSTFAGEENAIKDAGRELLNRGCIQCHALDGEQLPGVVGIDLSLMSQRLHSQWIHDFLLNPNNLKPRTRMPTFFPNGVSSNSKILKGNVEQQITALWVYLKSDSQRQLPEKLIQARNQSFELIPTDRPIVQRTFMKHGGTHAIAVGFPQKVHFVYDPQFLTVTEAWRGRFLDAYRTWFVRVAVPETPLGTQVVQFSAALPLAELNSRTSLWPKSTKDQQKTLTENEYRFRGYRFDRNGIPRFLFDWKSWRIADRIEPNDKQGLKRTLSFQIQSKSPSDSQTKMKSTLFWIHLLEGKSITKLKNGDFQNDKGIRITLENPLGRNALIRKSDNRTELVVPFKPKEQNFSVEWRIHW